MAWIIAATGGLIGMLGVGVALGSRLRIASLEQALAQGDSSESARREATVLSRPPRAVPFDRESGPPH